MDIIISETLTIQGTVLRNNGKIKMLTIEDYFDILIESRTGDVVIYYGINQKCLSFKFIGNIELGFRIMNVHEGTLTQYSCQHQNIIQSVSILKDNYLFRQYSTEYQLITSIGSFLETFVQGPEQDFIFGDTSEVVSLSVRCSQQLLENKSLNAILMDNRDYIINIKHDNHYYLCIRSDNESYVSRQQMQVVHYDFPFLVKEILNKKGACCVIDRNNEISFGMYEQNELLEVFEPDQQFIDIVDQLPSIINQLFLISLKLTLQKNRLFGQDAEKIQMVNNFEIFPQCFYTGQILHNLIMHGQGVLNCSQTQYSGQFNFGKFEGYGLLIINDRTFEGLFMQNFYVASNYFHQFHINNNVYPENEYIGEYKLLFNIPTMNGIGELVQHSKVLGISSIKGCFLLSKPTDLCQFVMDNGHIFKGLSKRNGIINYLQCKDFYRRVELQTNSIYYGQLQNYRPHGAGIFVIGNEVLYQYSLENLSINIRDHQIFVKAECIELQQGPRFEIKVDDNQFVISTLTDLQVQFFNLDTNISFVLQPNGDFQFESQHKVVEQINYPRIFKQLYTEIGFLHNQGLQRISPSNILLIQKVNGLTNLAFKLQNILMTKQLQEVFALFVRNLAELEPLMFQFVEPL